MELLNDYNELEDLGIIKINYEVFRNTYDKLNSPISENIINKANELIDNYNCFSNNYDARSLWEKKKIIAQNKSIKSQKPRHHIINIDFSDRAKCKKEFISYLNKLTDLNKDVIYSKISSFIKELDGEILNSLFEILINFMKSSNNNIYVDVLYLFEQSYIDDNINNYYLKFLENKEWLPSKIIEEYKFIFDENNYDEYCEYVKIKKSTLSLLKALSLILKKLNKNDVIEKIINLIFEDLNIFKNKKEFKHIIELLLDELSIIIDFMPKQEFIDKINNIDISNLDTSTKFKITYILEKFN
jgi:hypothetical protein